MAGHKRSRIGRLGTLLRWSMLLVLALVVAAAAILFTTDFNSYRAAIAERAEAATGRKVTLGGDLSLAFSLQPTLAVEDVAVANAPWGTRPQMFEARRIEAKLELLPLLSGTLAIARIALVSPQMYLETDGEGIGNWVFAAADSAEPKTTSDEGQPLTVSVKDVAISDALFTFRDGQADRLTEVALDRIRLAADGLDKPLQISVDGHYLDRPFSLSGTLASLAALQSDDAAIPADLEASYADVTVALSGTVPRPGAAAQGQLSLDARADSLAALGTAFGVDLSGVGPLALQASLSGNANAADIALKSLRLGDSDLRGQIAVTLDKNRPFVKADLEAGQLVLDPFLNLADAYNDSPAPSPGEKTTDAPGPVLSREPIPAFALMRRFNAELSLRAGLIKLREHRLRDLDVGATLRDGAFALDLKRVSFHDGSVIGRLSVAEGANAPTVAARFKVAGLDVGSLEAALRGSALLESTLDATVELRGTGHSPHELAAGSDGFVRVALGEGRINSRYAEMLAADLMRSLVPGGDAFARLNCGVARLDVADGVAQLSSFLVDSERMAVGGEGSADLGAETLALIMLPRPKNPSLLSLAVPINIGGTFARPTVGPDQMALATGVAGALIGTAINPLGILVPFVSGGKGGADACVAALEAAKHAVPADGAAKPAPSSAPDKIIQGVEDGLKGVERGLRGIFGR